MKSSRHVVIIGNGISGVTCARYLRKQDSDVCITIISSETQHFFSRTALMYIYMGHMRYEDTKPYEDHFWEKNRIHLVYDHVTSVHTANKQVQLKDGEPISYGSLVLATGSTPNKFGWPGQELKGVQGLYSYKDLQQMEENTIGIKNAVVVGGGLIGVEMAEMLHSRGINVKFLVREGHFWGGVLPKEESDMIGKHIVQHGIDLQLNAELEKINGEDGVNSITTKSGEEIPCEFVGLTVGVHPNISFLEGSGIETDRGIVVNEFFETNVPCVYAIGDCAQFKEPPGEGRRNIEQVWYTGRMQGKLLAANILGEKQAYRPGNWFNSAKFFDIEYQTYGWVWNQTKENESTFYWQHPSKELAFRVNWDTESKVVLGVNTFGIRIRHEIMDQWLSENISVIDFFKKFRKVNFDPEFYKKYENDIVDQFNKENNQKISLSRKKWVKIFSSLFVF